MKNNNKKSSFEPEALIWIALASGFCALIIQVLISYFTEVPSIFSGVAMVVLFAAASAALIVKYRATLHKYCFMHSKVLKNGEVLTNLIEQSDIPAVITHDDGTVIWANKSMKQLIGGDGELFGKNMNRFFPFDIKALRRATYVGEEYDSIEIAKLISEGEEVKIFTEDGANYSASSRLANGHSGLEYMISDRRFLAKSYTVTLPTETGDEVRHYNLTLFDESTELFDLKDRVVRENPTVAYIVLDNLAELAQYVRVDYRVAANNIELHIKEWAEEIGGTICEYDRDKYMVIFSQEMLEKNILEGFPLLEKIHSEKLGDNSMSITASMGISSVGKTMLEREQNAKLALDTAIQRGGDQIVIKKEKSMDYYGGRSKSIQKREKISSRVIAKRVRELITNHKSVLVMGHKNPDCDSLGACIGMARFAKQVGGEELDVHIVTDKSTDTFAACTGALLGLDEYEDMFWSGEEALDCITSETLLVVVDANNFRILESSDLADSVADIVIIDHHRKVAELPRKVLLEYIDPSASSASELVSEMIESEFNETTLLKEEADVMLSGIMLDTMNFTRSTGMRTFSAAYFLRSSGAASERARAFFEDDLSQHLAEAKFFNSDKVIVYRQSIAIAVSMGCDEDYDRVAASKAAERLITVRGVEAAFALVKIGSSIHISARSTGKINVQLILEQVGGGGHFDAAGAQVTGRTMNEALLILKDAINSYLDEE